MAYEVVIPRLGLTMEEGRVLEWYKSDGEVIEPGEPLFSVETDKVVLDVEAAVGGIVQHIPGLPDEAMPIGTPIGYILAPGEQVVKAASPTAGAPAEGGPGKEAAVPAVAEGVVSASRPGRILASPAARRRASELGLDWRIVEREGDGPILLAHVEAAADAHATTGRIKASPVARRLAQASGLDLAKLAAGMPGKRIQRADVESAITARNASEPAPLQPPAPAQPPAISRAFSGAQASAGRIPVSTLAPGEDAFFSKRRQVIAQRMSESAHTTAAVSLTTEADATELVSLRERLKAVLAPRGMIVPSYTDLLIKLTAAALQQHPGLNAHVMTDRSIVFHRIDIGMAVDTGLGLVVPVIRDVSSKSIEQIAQEGRALAARAREGSLSPSDLEGGTFTLTNLGMFGVDAFAPIINAPQCAILGVGRIIAKPAVYDGQVVPRHMITLSLTFDHRAVDGAPAARFLATVREFVEEPCLWLYR